jgi:uncharacterized sulfatase
MPALRHLKLFSETDLPLPANYKDDYATRSDAARQQEMEIRQHTYPAFDLKFPPDTGNSRDFKFWQGEYDRFTPEQRATWDDAYRKENLKLAQLIENGRALDEYKYQRYIKDYLRCVTAIDENVGRILDYLDAEGLRNNTIVIYTSDQGFFLGEHGWFDKRFMYEEALRMPLLVRYPDKIKSGQEDTHLVLNIDFAPTLLDFAGIPVPPQMQGISLRPLLSGDAAPDWRREIYYHYYEYPGWHMVKKHYGIRTERYKLIHFYDDIDAWELYDLRQDPAEMRNRFDEPAYKPLADSLTGKMTHLIEVFGDTTVPAEAMTR